MKKGKIIRGVDFRGAPSRVALVDGFGKKIQTPSRGKPANANLPKQPA